MESKHTESKINTKSTCPVLCSCVQFFWMLYMNGVQHTWVRPDFSAFLVPWHPSIKVWRRNKRVWMKRQLLSGRQAWSGRGDGNLANYFSYDNRGAEDWSPAPVPAASSPHCSCMHTKRMTSPHTHTSFPSKAFFPVVRLSPQGVDVDVERFPIVLHNGK